MFTERGVVWQGLHFASGFYSITGKVDLCTGAIGALFRFGHFGAAVLQPRAFSSERSGALDGASPCEAPPPSDLSIANSDPQTSPRDLRAAGHDFGL